MVIRRKSDKTKRTRECRYFEHGITFQEGASGGDSCPVADCA